MLGANGSSESPGKTDGMGSVSSPTTSQLEWERSTGKLVGDAMYAHHLSAKQRTRAYDTQNYTDQGAYATLRSSCAALERKINESQGLLKRALDEISAIQHEDRTLEDVASVARNWIVRLQDPIAAAEQALAARTGRPESQNTRDHAERALRESLSGCAHCMRSLTTSVAAIEEEARKLSLCREALDRDVEAKNASIRLDVEALDLHEAQAAGELSGDKYKERSRPQAHPIQWRMNTENLLHDASRVRAASKRLRERTTTLINESHAVRESTTTGVIRGLKVKMEETEKLSKEVLEAMSSVQAEMETLSEAIGSVMRSEEGLESPLSVARARLSKRTVKPDGEYVLDAAEISLEREVQDLERSRRKLTEERGKQGSDMDKLEAQRLQMERDVREKEAALAIDTGCLASFKALEETYRQPGGTPESAGVPLGGGTSPSGVRDRLGTGASRPLAF